MALHSYKCPKCGATNINQDKHDKFANFELDDSDLVCKTCGYVDSEIKFLYDGQENLIKYTCRELGLTYKQLGEAIGLSEGSIKRLATSDEINTQAVKSCEMLLEIKNLKEQLSNTETLKTALKTLLD